MGEEGKCHLSLANRNYLHEVFHMEASRIFLFSYFKPIDSFFSKGKGVDTFYSKGKRIDDA